MVINIEQFLDQYGKKAQETEKKDQTKHKSLDFQREVEENLQDTVEQTKNEEFAVMKKIYEEIKNFDKDLPQKFLGIEKKGMSALKQIGGLYSKNYISKLTTYCEQLDNQISSKLALIDRSISESHFAQVIKTIMEAEQLLQTYPNQYSERKSVQYLLVREKQAQAYALLAKKKKELLPETRKQLIGTMMIVQKSIQERDLEKTKSAIAQLESQLQLLPKFLITELLDEREKAMQVLYNAHKTIYDWEKELFVEQEERISSYIDLLHKAQDEKNLEHALTIYNQILIEFKELPELFLDKKINLLQKVNELYEVINSLVISNHVTTFLSAYNTSKEVEEIYTLLEHFKSQRTPQQETVELIVTKIKTLPASCMEQRQRLSQELNQAIATKKNPVRIPQTSQFERVELKMPQQQQIQPVIVPKKVEEIININNPIFAKERKTILNEITLHCERILTSSNADELKILYKKTIFYIDTLNIPQTEKGAIAQKLIQIISRKNLNAQP